jgi:hypothetical protein
MDDLRQRLTEVAQQVADRAQGPGPEAARRRGRRRAGTRTTAAAFVLALIVGGFVIARGLGRDTAEIPSLSGSPAPTTPPTIALPVLGPLRPQDYALDQTLQAGGRRIGPLEIVAQGTNSGEAWRIVAYRASLKEGNSICAFFESTRTGRTATCQPETQGLAVASIGHRVYYGFVTKHVDTVRLTRNGATPTSVDVTPAKTGQEFPVNFYAVFAPPPSSSDEPADITALDTNGRQLCRRTLPPAVGKSSALTGKSSCSN